MVAKQPEDRFSSMDQVVAELQACLRQVQQSPVDTPVYAPAEGGVGVTESADISQLSIRTGVPPRK
jgi:hypothetical protein